MERNTKTNIMITAIIPVRKGSQRVKNKNKKPFGETSLLEIKINQLLKLHYMFQMKLKELLQENIKSMN